MMKKENNTQKQSKKSQIKMDSDLFLALFFRWAVNTIEVLCKIVF